MLYETLCDFLSPKELVLRGVGALVVAGWTAIYTPIYDGASAACPQHHSGRNVGIRDGMINVSPATASLSTAR